MASLSIYCLDVLVEAAEIAEDCNSIATPVFISLRADGLRRAARTSPAPIAPHVTWRRPFRLVLRLPGLDGFYLITSLCTRTGAGEDIAVAAGRLRLESLPFGRPARIVFPLQSAGDAAVQLAALTITTGISPITMPLQDADGATSQATAPNPYEAPGND
jgi:hypothetical protein